MRNKVFFTKLPELVSKEYIQDYVMMARPGALFSDAKLASFMVDPLYQVRYFVCLLFIRKALVDLLDKIQNKKSFGLTAIQKMVHIKKHPLMLGVVLSEPKLDPETIMCIETAAIEIKLMVETHILDIIDEVKDMSGEAHPLLSQLFPLHE